MKGNPEINNTVLSLVSKINIFVSGIVEKIIKNTELLSNGPDVSLIYFDFIRGPL